jgi:twitching motility protein PilT
MRVRLDGELRDFDAHGPVLSPEDVERMLREVLSAEQCEELARCRHLEFALTWSDRVRIRGSAYYQRGLTAASLRILPMKIPTIEQLGIPRSLVELVSLRQGLVLVTGPTGCGKSTTQAALIDHINRTRSWHVVTVEDPIEYVHTHSVSVVDQRQVGTDTPSFPVALRAVFRQDPDVVLIGEMRDLETMAAALTIAETGHLVLATLHTNDAAQAIDRILDVFPGPQQHQARTQLAASLAGVVYQQLLPAIGGGRVAAFEVLIVNQAVRALIRDGKLNQLRTVVQTSSRDGSHTLEAALTALVLDGVVSADVARARSLYPQEIGA